MVHPIPPGPHRHQSGEPAGDPVSLVIPCTSLVHHLYDSWPRKSTALHPRTESIQVEVSRGQDNRRANLCTHSHWYCKLPESVLVGIPQSADGIQWVSEGVSEVEQGTRVGGGWRMLQLQPMQSVGATQPRNVHLSHSVTGLFPSKPMCIPKFLPISILFTSTFAY